MHSYLLADSAKQSSLCIEGEFEVPIFSFCVYLLDMGSAPGDSTNIKGTVAVESK